MRDNPLSKSQVALLGALSSEAFARQKALGLLDLPSEVASDTKSAQAKFWRQRERAAETGHTELSDCRQSHFNGLLARFEGLAGHTERSYKTRVKEATNAAATTPAGAAMLRDLWHEAGKAKLGEVYVKTILRAQFKTSDFNDLNLDQIRALLATIRRRAKSKLANAGGEPRAKSEGPSAKSEAPRAKSEGPSRSREYTLRRPIEAKASDIDIPF